MSMRRRIGSGWACIGLAVVFVGGLVHPARAQNTSGGAVLASQVMLAAKGCGRFRGNGLLAIALMSDATWTATNDEDFVFGGNYIPSGVSGRTFDLDLDDPSLALLGATLAGNLSGLCQAAVDVTAMEKRRARLRLNRGGTKAKLKLRYRLMGTANGQPGVATLNLKAAGPWVAGTP